MEWKTAANSQKKLKTDACAARDSLGCYGMFFAAIFVRRKIRKIFGCGKPRAIFSLGGSPSGHRVRRIELLLERQQKGHSMNDTFRERSARRMSESDSALRLVVRFDAWLSAARLAVDSCAVCRWTCGSMLSVALAAVLGLGGIARGEVISGTILGSGINANLSTTFQRDSNWKIVAVPVGYTPADSQTVPYDAYVPRTVANSWLGSGGGAPNPQTGYTTGGTTYHWIAPDSNVTALSTALAPVDVNTPATWYKWIAAQTFTIPSDNNYFLNFPSAVDNRLDYFVNGTIDWTNPRQPTITGGFQITTTDPGEAYRPIVPVTSKNPVPRSATRRVVRVVSKNPKE